MRTLGALVAGVVVGTLSGVAAVVTHTDWWWLALGVGATATALWAARGAARVGLSLGWGVAVTRASLERPEGDYLVSANAQGWTLLGSSLVLVLGGLVAAALAALRVRDPRLRGTPS